MSRRKGRILAFQACYSWDVSGSSLEELLTFSWTQKEINSLEQEQNQINLDDSKLFARLLIPGIIQNIEEIDKRIVSHLSTNWSFERLSKVTLAILRTSIYEMLYVPDSEVKIVIDEAVNIAKEYGADDSYKFINAILDNIRKDENK